MRKPLAVLDIFSGIGGFSLGLEKAGMETIAFCEINSFCQKILKKHWQSVPIFSDITILTNKDLQFIIVTGGTSELEDFQYMLDDVFNKQASVGKIKLMGIRDNKYSSALGNILYFINKLRLKSKNYTMFSENDIENISIVKKNIVSRESMLGKVFGYFFGE